LFKKAFVELVRAHPSALNRLWITPSDLGVENEEKIFWGKVFSNASKNTEPTANNMLAAYKCDGKTVVFCEGMWYNKKRIMICTQNESLREDDLKDDLNRLHKLKKVTSSEHIQMLETFCSYNSSSSDFP
jgi:hypothetical protein